MHLRADDALDDDVGLGVLVGLRGGVLLGADDGLRDVVDVAVEYADLIAAELPAAGAAYVQIDEPSLGAWEDDFAVRCLERVVAAAPDGIRVALHACSSDLHAAFEVPVDEVSVPAAGSTGIPLADLAEAPPTADVGVGVVDSSSPAVESVGEIRRRIDRVTDVVDHRRVILTTDCGLGQLSRSVAFEKLDNVTSAARDVRRGLR